MENGLVHIYCGDGKGKTTAAMGLALRAVGAGFRVLIVQFLKDGKSGEIAILKTLPRVTILANEELSGFSFNMSGQEKAACGNFHEAQFAKAVEICTNGECDLLILDEVIGAINADVMSEESVVNFLKNRPKSVEVVLTGRSPNACLTAFADYMSEIKKVRHPFDKGLFARVGIEK